MSAEWIDFKQLRQQLKLADVLRHYRIDLKTSGSRATGLCPLPTHPQRGAGKRTPSFSVNLDRGLWNCFGCHAGGNVLDLAIRMEGKDPASPDDVRAVALKLAHTFNINGDDREPPTNASRRPQARRSSRDVKKEPSGDEPSDSKGHNATPSLPIVVNAPLDFELKQLDPVHPYLLDRGFTPETIAKFGLGFCSRGLLKDRIAIPLHDADGRLLGYAGRIVDDACIDDEHPKYLLPGPRERDGKRYELHKSELLYNHHRIGRINDTLVVVEGFPSVWWLDQHGHANAVALMGSRCSEAQAALLENLLTVGSAIIVLTDGDDAGRSCAGDLFVKLGHRRQLRYARLDDGEQPTDLSSDALAALLCA